MAWQVQDAKQKFSELVRKAVHEGPQVVTRHGEAVVVMISVETYRKLSGNGNDFKAFLLSSPEATDLELERLREPAREVEL